MKALHVMSALLSLSKSSPSQRVYSTRFKACLLLVGGCACSTCHHSACFATTRTYGKAPAAAVGNTGTQEQSGAATPGTMTDLTALGQGKKQMLGVNLDRMADSVSGQTTVDPSGYLTSLNSKTVRRDP